MTTPDAGTFLNRVRGGMAMNVSQHSTSTRSPVFAILASLVTGLVLLYMALEIGADSRIAGVNARIDALVALLEEDERAASPETPATASGSAGTRGTGPPGPAA